MDPNDRPEPTEHSFTCPYCWQPISMIIEPTAAHQEYVEDCEVCCNPVLVAFQVVDDELVFVAKDLGQ